jgi:hypothetical protein
MKRLKIWGGIGGGIVLVTVVAVLLLRHWTQGSATGTVTVGSPAAPHQDALQTAPKTVHVDTIYFSTVLPAGFTIKRQVETPGQPTLLQLSASTNSQTDETFSATYGAMPSGGLTDLSDYTLRAQDAATYARTDLPDLPSGAVAFRTVSGPAGLTVLMPHGNDYIALAFTAESTGTEAKLQSLYEQALSGWDWK